MFTVRFAAQEKPMFSNSVLSELVVLKTQAHNTQHITSKTTLNRWQSLLSWQWVPGTIS